MQLNDVVYHMYLEFFGRVSNIYLDGSPESVYYGVHGLNGRYLGSFPAISFIQSSRC